MTIHKWAIVDREAPCVRRTIRMVGTGHPMDDLDAKAPYIGTIQAHGGSLVLHFFDLGEEG